ncbi:MAG TPA: hypothetical protein VE988_11780, partial [Gemmataceae bacterium]|nr:hypothetical protein [Gemmataceae bacterium]
MDKSNDCRQDAREFQALLRILGIDDESCCLPIAPHHPPSGDSPPGKSKNREPWLLLNAFSFRGWLRAYCWSLRSSAIKTNQRPEGIALFQIIQGL